MSEMIYGIHAVQALLESRRPRLVDFHRKAGREGEVVLDLLVPLFAEGETGRLIGYALFEIDPALWLQETDLTEDFYRTFIRRNASQRELVWFGRSMVLLVSVVAVWLARDPNSLVLSLVSFGIALLGTLALNCDHKLVDFVQNAIVNGVGAVLGFLPQMAVLFLCMAILEDCGYMARVAFVMDRIFRKFGLSGKSFIPMLVSMGCGVPGVMATRTIENEKDRRMTIMTTTFIPCGAKTPIIALIAGAFFPENSWVAPGAYFIGVGAIILSGLILKKTAMFAGDPTPFVMELPIYHIPAWKNVIIHAWDRCKAFVQKAGTVIFVSSALIWFLSSYNWKVDSVEQNDSMLASIGNVAAPVFQPLGWGEWKPTMATITGLIAKENVVGTFGVLYADGSSGEDEAEKTEDSPETQEMSPAGRELQASLEEGSGESAAEAEEEEDEDEEIRETGDRLVQAGAFTFLSAFSFMIFNLLCAPCFAAMGAIRREMNSAKWTFFAIGYMCALAYCLAFLIYQLGAWLYAEASFGIGQGIALLLLLGLVYLVAKKPYTASK